jgi:hypothetical protein
MARSTIPASSSSSSSSRPSEGLPIDFAGLFAFLAASFAVLASGLGNLAERLKEIGPVQYALDRTTAFLSSASGLPFVRSAKATAANALVSAGAMLSAIGADVQIEKALNILGFGSAPSSRSGGAGSRRPALYRTAREEEEEEEARLRTRRPSVFKQAAEGGEFAYACEGESGVSDACASSIHPISPASSFPFPFLPPPSSPDGCCDDLVAPPRAHRRAPLAPRGRLLLRGRREDCGDSARLTLLVP